MKIFNIFKFFYSYDRSKQKKVLITTKLTQKNNNSKYKKIIEFFFNF